MTETLEMKTEYLSLPRKRFSELSHKKNIDYCIQKLREAQHIIDPVIGYVIQRSIRTIHLRYQVLSREIAQNLKSQNERFSYTSLEKFLERQQDIKNGRYKLSDDGLIMGER